MCAVIYRSRHSLDKTRGVKVKNKTISGHEVREKQEEKQHVLRGGPNQNLSLGI